jgi:S-DNA-T family DNA segregation ATPase FtsK/SpoIIIE
MAGKTANSKVIKEIPIEADYPPRSASGEYLGILFVAAAIFLGLCLVSYDPRDPSFNVATTRPHVSNLCGLIGSHIADALAQLLGISSLLIPLALVTLATGLFWPGRVPVRRAQVLSILFATVLFSGLLERFSVGPIMKFPVEHPGGAVGVFVHGSFQKFVGSGGELLLSLTLILLCLLHLFRVSVTSAIAFVGPVAVAPAEWGSNLWQKLKAIFDQAWRPSAQPRRRYELGIPQFSVKDASFEDDDEPWEPIKPAPRSTDKVANPTMSANPASRDERTGPSPIQEYEAPSKKAHWKSLGFSGRGITSRAMEEAIQEYLRELEGTSTPPRRRELPESQDQEAPRPIKVTRRADEDIPTTGVSVTNNPNGDDFVLPPIDLLDVPPPSSRAIDEKLMEQNAAILEQKLADLGVKGEVVEIHPGPVITMFELTLAPGIPLRRVLNMSDDLAMALKSGSTRVVAPIPGKDTVGIEVPNLNREIVYFREIIESPAFMGSDAALKVALGKNIDGEPFATSLTRMPHLLIAGATGTGKSVGLNCLICSWLMSCHPDDVKFIMVDPKKLELSYYQDIPHLLHPVVTEADKVPKVLSWAIREMERRYDLLSKAGAKNIEGYNTMVRSGQLNSEPDAAPPEKLPYVVIIVDELAELMMVAAKDIEISIARLAQMARASGIHLILATQRPSVDVITGVIKANFPARLSFQVSAKPDSRTILDTTGAEHLLGMGDMLFLPPGTAKLRRLHGAYVSENEIRRIVDFIKAQRSPVYLQEITTLVSDDESASSADLIDDPKYDEAVELVTRLGHASISLIQRHMRIGYNRAARIIEAMESEGLIGPSDGTSRPREVHARSLEHIQDR